MKATLRSLLVFAVVAAIGSLHPNAARAEGETRFDLYGFAMMDAGYNNKAIDPSWFDTQRPTKLESFKNEFGKDGSTFFSVRQTRFGVKSWTPTDMGELKTTFEFEMFGVGVDAGQTTIRLRHAYGEIGKWGAGQTWSPFMDIDVFPNTLEYWGPNGMAFFRNVQVRYMPIQGDTRATIALERPGASADQGVYSDIIGGNVKARFPLPDLSAEYRKALAKGGYVEIAGIVRSIQWQDLGASGGVDLSGNVLGWGINGSSNLKIGEGNIARLQVVYGEGIENYMNDAPVDVGTKATTNPSKPVDGVALPVTGIVAFLDHTWNPKMSSSVGFSMVSIDNSEGQAYNAFKDGQYALANLLFTPVKDVMWGVEAGWIHRDNKAGPSPGIDAYKVDDYHVQVSFKYNFAYSTHPQQ